MLAFQVIIVLSRLEIDMKTATASGGGMKLATGDTHAFLLAFYMCVYSGYMHISIEAVAICY